MGKISIYILAAAATITCCGCSVSQKALLHYYTQNQKTLDSMEAGYKKLYAQKPFSVAFDDKRFNYFSLTIITDSLQYIYDFASADETRFNDTLARYKLSIPGIMSLMNQMRRMRCTWINTLDYYVNGRQMFMVFMSARPVLVNEPFTFKKYYILAYFPEPQFFDEEGRLYTGRRARRLRKINNEVYSKLTDRVCYTISENFR